MKASLKKSVQKHYSQQQMDDHQLTQLEALYTGITKTAEKTGKPVTTVKNLYPWLVSVAATIFLAISLLLFYLPQSNEQRIMAIAEEVAKEHLHQNSLEISSKHFNVIQDYFSKLDFMPNISSRFGSADKLLGGRYCSIRNITAAQIRYMADQTSDTLYQVSYDPTHFGRIPNIDQGDSPLIRHVKGIQLEMWVEKGLLMVGAKNTNPP